MDFDASLGFPGEGPAFLPASDGFRKWDHCCGFSLSVLVLSSLLVPVPLRSHRRCFLVPRFLFWLLLFSFGAPGAAMDVFAPGNYAAERLRSEQRLLIGPLPTGRLVLPRTAQQRTWHLSVFRECCVLEGINLDFLLENFRECVDELNLILCRFGKVLYSIGRPRNHYIESMRPSTV